MKSINHCRGKLAKVSGRGAKSKAAPFAFHKNGFASDNGEKWQLFLVRAEYNL